MNVMSLLLLLLIFKNKKVKMIAVGVGSGIDYSELKEIADNKPANVIHVDKFEDLFVRLKSVMRASCEPQ